MPRRRRPLRQPAQSRAPEPFCLDIIAARGAGDPGMPERNWPIEDAGFLAEVLYAQQTPAPLVARLAGQSFAPATSMLDRLAEAIGANFLFAPLAEALRHRTLMLIGPPGAGKTTVAAKLAARLEPSEVLMISTDTERAGGVAQLRDHLAVLGLEVTAVPDSAALAAASAGAVGRRVIIDTAGCSLDDVERGSALRALAAAARAEPMLVLPADTAANEAAQLARAAAAIGARHLFVTRLDLVRRIGSVLAGADAGRLTLVNGSVTPHFAFGLHALTPEIVARRLLAGALHDERWRLDAH
jgi:flagellar biosynthesis protein FlhF